MYSLRVMKKRVLSSILAFAVAWVAVGALDCGCAYAAAMEMSAHKTSENMDCHGFEEAQSKKVEDECCSGCQVESRAPFPPSIQVSSLTQGQFSRLTPYGSQAGALRFIAPGSFLPEIPTFHLERAHGVPFYDTPIYLAVQSLLI